MRTKPKKSLGQNFLIDQNVQRKIISSCGLQTSDVVLEIGAGRGELTSLLVGNVSKIYAFEIDRCLFDELKAKFKDNTNIEIINGDILKVDLAQMLKKEKLKIKVIANIPYYISTPIIEKLFEIKEKIGEIFITVQKEFCERVTADPGSKKFGSLSCFIQYYVKAKILFTIQNSSFWPKPKVDSSFLRLEILSKPSVKVGDEKLLFKVIRAAFNQRRKTLRNSLENIAAKEKLCKYFEINNINPNIRPEDLSLENFARLADHLNK